MYPMSNHVQQAGFSIAFLVSLLLTISALHSKNVLLS